MPRWVRLGVPWLLLVLIFGWGLLSNWQQSTSLAPTQTPASSGADEPTADPSPTPVPPVGGTELYGYLPYWQVTDSMAAYLDSVPLTTLAMFSVSARRNGAIDNRDPGYKRITGALGRRIIADAHARGARVELVFTSFGGDKNGRFFGRLATPVSRRS